MLKKIWLHFKLITKHKWIVFNLCSRVGMPWRGLIHDLSKYSPSEFWESAKFYVGYKSPIQVAREKREYSLAWLHHKGRNKHHMEYWIDYRQTGDKKMTGIKMPEKYVVEMFCDRIAGNNSGRIPEALKIPDPMLKTVKRKIMQVFRMADLLSVAARPAGI